MEVIVLHPSDEIKICRMIKEISSYLAKKALPVYKTIPLWIPVSFDRNDKINEVIDKRTQLKELAEKIKDIKISAPLKDEDELYCPVEIIFSDSTYILETKLNLLHFFNTQKDKTISSMPLQKDFLSQADFTLSISFPLKIKVFRIAEAVDLSKNTKALTDSVWKKIR